jgi:hypothetical protein
MMMMKCDNVRHLYYVLEKQRTLILGTIPLHRFSRLRFLSFFNHACLLLQLLLPAPALGVDKDSSAINATLVVRSVHTKKYIAVEL